MRNRVGPNRLPGSLIAQYNEINCKFFLAVGFALRFSLFVCVCECVVGSFVWRVNRMWPPVDPARIYRDFCF